MKSQRFPETVSYLSEPSLIFGTTSILPTSPPTLNKQEVFTQR